MKNKKEVSLRFRAAAMLLFLAAFLLLGVCPVMASADNADLADGQVSDVPGVTSGGAEDGMISDTTEKMTSEPVTTAKSTTARVTSAAGESAGITSAAGMEDGMSGTTIGIIIAVIVAIAVVVLIFLILPRGKDDHGKKH